MLKNQARSNYINEYDRLKGEMDRRKVRGLHGYSRIGSQLINIKKLVKQSLNGETHEIYQKNKVEKTANAVVIFVC